MQVRVCMAGYPGRHSYDQFYKRYRLLEPSAGSTASDAQAATKALVDALKLSEGQYQLGLTKLFLKGGEVREPPIHSLHFLWNFSLTDIFMKYIVWVERQIAILERKRGEKLTDAAVVVQKTWRSFKARKRFRRLMRCLVKMQSCTSSPF
jgi:myosin heavy subunit